MRRELKQSELDEIIQVVRRGDRLGAVSLYISATEAGLTEAQDFVRALTAKERGESTDGGNKNSQKVG
ncbi:MAG: hypothetical protein EOP84_17325 [Verrucomicrobiaceae bacterium]|nr:MAG: hypothetical protein EOP84_17325 [Verrucomicrobiaceae bacterium]